MSARKLLQAVGALLLYLPSIIQEAAGEKGLSIPQPGPPPLDDLTGRYGSAHPHCPDPIWPQFPVVMTYLSGVAAEPTKIKVPVSTYAPITRVEGFTGQTFSPVSPLEPSLTSAFGAKITIRNQRFFVGSM